MGLILDSSVIVAAERGAQSVELAQLAGRIDAEARRRGVVIPFADLQVGVTALRHGYSVATLNERHFRLIPGLELTRL